MHESGPAVAQATGQLSSRALTGKAPSTLLTITLGYPPETDTRTVSQISRLRKNARCFKKLISYMRLEESIMKATTLPEQPGEHQRPAG